MSKEWREELNGDPIPWLLEEGEPWVRYRTLVDLLDRPENDPEVVAARRDMVDHPEVRKLIEDTAAWPGYFLKRHNDARHPLHKLAVLADFGLRADDPGMDKVVDAVMAHQAPEGAFQSVVLIPKAFGGTDEEMWTWMLCDAPTLLYALLCFGLDEDPGVKRAVKHLSSLISENGWPCAASSDLGKFKGPGRREDPCPYANLLALKALSRARETLTGPVTRKAADMLLWHWEHQGERKLYMFGIGTDFRKLKYPFIWYDILHVTDTLSCLSFTRKDTRLSAIVEIILDKQDDRGRFAPESVWMAWNSWGFGRKKAPSSWITLLCCRLLKRLDK